MPTIKINKQVLTFNNIYYVDSTKGLDTNDGSLSSPFATVNYAVTKCATDGDAIFAKAGTHDVTRIAGTYDSGGLWDDNKAISFIGEKGKTIFLCDGTKHSGRDTHCIMFKNAGTRAYQIIFDFNTGNRTLNYETSICYAGSNVSGEVHNCVIRYSKNVSPSLMYGNSTSATIKFVNCVFDVQKNFTSSYSGIGSTTLENCATNFTFFSEATRVNIYNQCTFDSKYHITNFNEVALNIGVYANTYRWNFSSILFKKNDGVYSPITTQKALKENLSKYVKSVTASGGLTPEKTIDGNATGSSSYSWYSSGLPSAWIKYEFNDAIAIDRISILSYYYSGYEGIKDFVIEASHTGQFTGEQSVLYTGTHPNDTTSSFVQYSFPNHIKYKFYRIDIKNIYYGNGNDNLSIVEVQFWKDFDVISLLRLDSLSLENFVGYGGSNPFGCGLINSRQYLLQESDKESTSGLLVSKVESKPLNINFN
ncbi:discoidin domain-containing protein [Lysinibacillus capsici]|uniref:discoidin domain-containing protein n=1 Tax=Lysinibacillus capsici TaxID=2115968 RepID=UPI002FDE00DF